MIAQYERAKILERGRRGRRHAARSGSVSAPPASCPSAIAASRRTRAAGWRASRPWPRTPAGSA
jgi:DNA invertase Pin-like site-specific DNA recombinase